MLAIAAAPVVLATIAAALAIPTAITTVTWSRVVAGIRAAVAVAVAATCTCTCTCIDTSTSASPATASKPIRAATVIPTRCARGIPRDATTAAHVTTAHAATAHAAAAATDAAHTTRSASHATTRAAARVAAALLRRRLRGQCVLATLYRRCEL